MDWLFFIRCIETAVAILGMTFSIAEFYPDSKWRLKVSTLIIFVSCIFFTLIYTHLGQAISEKIYLPFILVILGFLIFKNSADCYFINLFNFLTQLVIYLGISMLSTFMVKTTFSISYLAIRAIIFTFIILVEIKFVRKKFRYIVYMTKSEKSEWYAASVVVIMFATLIIFQSSFPLFYYDASSYDLIKIVLTYVLMALIYHVFYVSMHNTIQKYELLQSEALMKEKLNSMKKYKELAETDPLTGVLNRRAFQNQIKSSFISGKVGILIMMDIDNFKNINDYFGHDTGDEVLRALSDTLKSSFSNSDIIARFGGDEFAVFLCNDQVNKEQIMQKTGDFYQALSHRISSQKTLPDFSVSIGIAYKNSYTDFSKLYKDADKALYQAKKRGKNCVVFYDENLYTRSE
jgi:diguanylate cyclase (GGDEF)-like protein